MLRVVARSGEPGLDHTMDAVSEPAPVADGLDHSLDPRVIPLQRIGGGIFTALLAVGSLVALVICSDDGSPWLEGCRRGWCWSCSPRGRPIGGHLARIAHTSYRVDDQGIEIRRGVYWRVVINVPRSRVQHIDVSQGPIERNYGLGTLVIYTAGTDHAKVELEGLEHGRAIRIRQHLLPSESGDAV